MNLRSAVGLICLWLHGAGALGQAIFPDPPVAGKPLFLNAALPQESCFNTLQVNGVTTSGSEVTVNYTVIPGTPPGFLCFTIEPPLVMHVPIGSFTVGQYTARAIGDFLGVPNPPIAVAFTVLAPPVSAVEYYWASAGHYFITANPDEINALDGGYFPGWTRTGQTITVFPPAVVPSGTPSPVCRFYGRPEAGLDSHFYSAAPAECQAVIDRYSYAWLYESPNVFMAYLPNPLDGSCPANTSPVYRVYSNRPDSNHRYTTSLTIRAQMLNAGWVAEGYGPNAVAMCAP